MNCPECHKVMPEGMCYECGIFFDTPVFEVHDLHNYNVQPKTRLKKARSLQGGIESVSGEGDAGDT